MAADPGAREGMNRLLRAYSFSAFVTTAVLLSLSLSAAAQSPTPTPRPDANAGVTVEAESLLLNEADRIAVFRGDVLATQGGLSLRSEEMRVRYGDAAGGAGPEIERIDASGGVIIILNGDEIRGDEATYDLVARTFEATGNVVLLRDGNRVQGQRFIANLDTGESEIVGRVTVQFNPTTTGESGSSQ